MTIQTRLFIFLGVRVESLLRVYRSLDTMKFVFSVLTLILMFTRSSVLTQSPTFEELLASSKCEPFDQQPVSCVDFMGTGEVWTVPSYGLTQEYFNGKMFEFLFKDNTSGITILEITNIMPYDCATAYLRLICPTFFQPCTSDSDVLEGVSIPHPVCRSVCDDTNLACSDFWVSNAIPQLNCTFLYPSELFTCVIPPVIQQNATYHCPQPTMLIAPEVDPNSGLPCAVPCSTKVTLVYPEDQQDSFSDQYIALSVLSWISFIGVILTFFAALVSPAIRQFPQRILLHLGSGLFVLHLGPVGSSFFGAVDLVCKDFQWVTATGSWCKFASFCLFWGSVYTSIWWVYLAFILFWNDVLKRSKDRRIERGEYVLLVVAAFWTTLESLIMLWYPSEDASGGYLSGFPFCGLGPKADRDLFWGLVMGTVMTCLLLVILFILPVLFTTLTKCTKCNLSCVIERVLNELSRFLFIFSFIFVVIAVVAVQSWGEQFRSHVAFEVQNWYGCMLFGLVPWEICTRGSVNISLWWFQNLTLGLLGTCYFITFCLAHRKRTRLWITRKLTSVQR